MSNNMHKEHFQILMSLIQNLSPKDVYWGSSSLGSGERCSTLEEGWITEALPEALLEATEGESAYRERGFIEEAS